MFSILVIVNIIHPTNIPSNTLYKNVNDKICNPNVPVKKLKIEPNSISIKIRPQRRINENATFLILESLDLTRCDIGYFTIP